MPNGTLCPTLGFRQILRETGSWYPLTCVVAEQKRNAVLLEVMSDGRRFRRTLTIKIDRRQLLNPQLFKLSEISAGIVSGFSRGFQQVQRFKLEGVTAKFIPVLLKFAIFVAAQP